MPFLQDTEITLIIFKYLSKAQNFVARFCVHEVKYLPKNFFFERIAKHQTLISQKCFACETPKKKSQS